MPILEQMVYLSIIIPCYNEEGRINETLTRIFKYLSVQNYTWEIIVIDDGSHDRTSEIAKEVIKDERLTILKNAFNCGKGYSVKRGVLASKGEIILFSDADLSVPIEAFDTMLPWIDRGYDIVIGSRALPDSMIEVHQPWYRRTMGKTFNLLVRTFVLRGFKDTQCGFKCFKRNAASRIFSNQRLSGFAFDVEVLYVATKMGLKIKQLPLEWRNSPHTTVGILSGSISMLIELFKIPFYDRKGYYKF